ncbi:uncharacterized protein C9orf43 homolog isoform X2 [Hyperolius riggenbachi]|uniref:uncharacterized protein C9orf43 homolog isoform X2 n=1 Tax=Hyperolius riggenbachi TaxID=752182 RepID=UPI0035A2CD92
MLLWGPVLGAAHRRAGRNAASAGNMKNNMAANLELDETFCSASLCQHPQCWVTFRRIEQGLPRYRPRRSVTRTPALDQGGLPVLTVTTLPISRTSTNEEDSEHRHVSSVDLVRTSSLSVHNNYNSASYSMDKILFPGLNSYGEITEAARRSASFSSPRRPQKVGKVDTFLQDVTRKHVAMMWVPNSTQKSQKEENREKPLKVQIKQLTFADVCGGARRENRDTDATKVRRANKPPTGGCPHNLTLLSSSSVSQSHGRRRMTASSVKENTEEMRHSRRFSEYYLSDSESRPDPGVDGALLENRRAVLHDKRERHQPAPPTSQSGPVYRLDKQSEAAEDEQIDLNSIRNQFYLWKKYIGLAGPSHRIKPPDYKSGKAHKSRPLRPSVLPGNLGLFPYDPDSALSYYRQQVSDSPGGSVVCATERSVDSAGSRSSPSLAGFSESSSVEVEPTNTPTDLDSRKISKQDSPGGAAEEADPKGQTGNKGSFPSPDQRNEHLPREEEPRVEDAFPEQAEAIVRSPEVTEEQEDSTEQRTISPQPNPPPPSPMQGSSMSGL